MGSTYHLDHLAAAQTFDLCLIGGRLVDLATGELRSAAVALAGPRVAAIGDAHRLGSVSRHVIDVAEQLILPGYIEPHGHMLLANPTEFAGVLLRHGTTTAVVDALPLMLLARPSHLSSLLDELAALPMKFRWLIRLHPQSFADTGERFALPTLRALWRAPFAAAVGEVTGWVDVLQGDPDLLAKIRAAREDGRRVEGHAAGASYERLAALAEAGFTSCHEAITADEVRDRLRAGLVTMLRHSSIRPDLPDLVRGITSEDIAAGRVMLTADGPTPVFIADHGYLDYLLEVAISAGVHPMDALRMVTVNPARYYGMRNLGEIAVGTQADINVVRDLRRPTPSLVIANGTIAAKDGMLLARMPTPAWDAAFEPATIPRLPADVFTTAGAATPGIRMINDVITEPVPAPDLPPTALRVALLDRRGRWIIQTRLVGFADRLGGLATTISSGFDIVILGQHPPDMARALAAVADMGGGLVVTDGGRVFSLPLELGAFSLQSWTEVVDANRQFNLMLQERGYRFADPVFSLLFLTFDSLPWIRLTSRGVWDVRNRRVLAASRPL